MTTVDDTKKIRSIWREQRKLILDMVRGGSVFIAGEFRFELRITEIESVVLAQVACGDVILVQGALT